MRPIKQTRALALMLSLAAALSLAVLPAHAGRFQDVTDQRVSQAADALSALGVVSGTGEGEFSPDGRLTRAQLCKMAVEIMGMGEQAEAQAYRTIFIDMKNHWARGYVNLAAITEVPVESGTRLMLGLGNGRFGPDREVTYQEAATLVLRILGYGEEANRAWPHSAVEAATQLGLDQNLGIEKPSDPITRGQTALLFYHMLSAPTKEDGKPYAAKVGEPDGDAILLATDATVNGRPGWVVVATGEGTKTYLAAGSVDQSLLGKRGWAVIDKQGRFVTLLPDESSCATGAVQRKEAYYLYLNNQRYALSEDTPVYTGSTREGSVTTYKEYMASLRNGTMVTLYLDQGKVVGLYRAEGSSETRFLVVGNRGANEEIFSAITGNDRNYTIRKNGASVPMSAIKQYDVVTYDPVTRVLDVCDVRLPCVYENASPSPSSPNRITVAGGNELDVMADAIGDFSGKKIGDSFTLMLTAGGKVAGLLPKEAEKDRTVSSFALGVVSGDSFQLLGCNLALTGGVLEDKAYAGDILNASAKEGALSLGPVGKKLFAQFNTVDLTLDKSQVSPNVQVFERSGSGLVVRSLSELPSNVTVAQYHKGSAGMIDLIILANYSGDGAEYGRIDVVNGYKLVKLSSGVTADKDRWTLQPMQGLVFTGKDGDKTYPVGTRLYSSGYGAVTEYEGVPSVTYLQAIPKVRSSDFYTQGGVMYVRTSKGVYPVDEDVQCFNAAASTGGSGNMPDWVRTILGSSGGVYEGSLNVGEGTTWDPGSDGIKVKKFGSLGECRNFADTVTVYIDATGQRVRVVEAGS